MPTGYVIVDPVTVRGPDGRDHSVLDAIEALPWTAQLCPLMRHEYTIWQKGPEWAWNVISAMLLARNPDSFRAYFRGYPSANRYWDAPDGLRYWRGKFEIDRGQPDGAGQRRVDEGARAIRDWDGPPWAPNGIGLYEQDAKGGWWPTEAALASGYQRCSACEVTTRKADVVVTPQGRPRILALIAAAQDDSLARLGRGLTREELTGVLSQYPDTGEAVSSIRSHVAASEESQVTAELPSPGGDLDEQWIALYDAGALIGRSYATVRKWASGEQPKLRVEQHPTDRRAVIVRISDLLRVHAQENRRGLRRTVRVLTRADGRVFTVLSFERID